MEQEGIAGEGTGSTEWGGRGLAESEESSKEGLARKAGPSGVRMKAVWEQDDREAGKLSPWTEAELQAPEPGHSAGSVGTLGLSCHSEMLPETGLCLTYDHTGLVWFPEQAPHVHSLLGKPACFFWDMSWSLPDLYGQPVLFAL